MNRRTTESGASLDSVVIIAGGVDGYDPAPECKGVNADIEKAWNPEGGLTLNDDSLTFS